LDLGIALAARNNLAGATNEFSEAMRLDSMDPAPLVEWSKALLARGHDADAVEKLREALQLDPDDFQTLTFAARVLAADEDPKIRDGKTALTYAQAADALTGGAQPLVQDVLGMAYAENGQFDQAQTAVISAISVATAAGMKSGTIAAMQGRLELYQKHEPWREAFLNTKNRIER
jgi:Flp pilus assembly protein TadD